MPVKYKLKTSKIDQPKLYRLNIFDGASYNLVSIQHETTKAYLVELAGNGRTCWLPKAGVTIESDSLTVEDWLYEKANEEQDFVLNLQDHLS